MEVVFLVCETALVDDEACIDSASLRCFQYFVEWDYNQIPQSGIEQAQEKGSCGVFAWNRNGFAIEVGRIQRICRDD